MRAHAAHEHQRQAIEDRDVGERIAVHEDQVGVLADVYGAGAIGDSEQIRRVRGGRSGWRPPG